MADQDHSDIADVDHWFGNDLALSATGDLGRATRVIRSRQRVLRRLMTAEGDYVSHPDYGSGLPQRIGDNLELARVRADIRTQMAREASVKQPPDGQEPSVEVSEIQGGVLCDISYTVAPEGEPARLAFSADAGE